MYKASVRALSSGEARAPHCVSLQALASAVLASSSDAGCGTAKGGSEMTWCRFAAPRWRRHVSAALHFRLREGEGVERAALTIARDITRFSPRIDRIFPGEALNPFFGAQDEGFLDLRS